MPAPKVGLDTDKDRETEASSFPSGSVSLQVYRDIKCTIYMQAASPPPLLPQ